MNYLEIIKNVVNNGTPKQATRHDSSGNVIPVENGTIGTFCEIFRHDMSQGFPLTTLRKMPWRSIRVELEGFIKGITDKSWYQERKCGFWDDWCSPQDFERISKENFFDFDNGCWPTEGHKERTRKEILKTGNNLGPIYGYQWRSFAEHYGSEIKSHTPSSLNSSSGVKINGVEKGFDQLKSIVDKLHSSPHDRRMICSAWNPNQMNMMALPPCHWGWNVVVYGDKLNLVWHQRSVDSSHGLPANIASYGLLLMLLCKESGLEPGELVGTLADCHLYDNTLNAVKIMIEREEKQLPTLKIKAKEDDSFSIFDWEWNEAELLGYDPHPPISMGAVTV